MITSQQLLDKGFRKTRTYTHSNYRTDVYKNHTLLVELDYLLPSGELHASEIIIPDIMIRNSDVSKLDTILALTTPLDGEVITVNSGTYIHN